MPFRGPKTPELIPYFFSSYPCSSGVPLAPLLGELSNYCQRTGKWKEFPQIVPAAATSAKKIGQIHKAAVYNSSLLLPTAACDMAAQPQGESCLLISLIIKFKIPTYKKIMTFPNNM